MASNSAYPLQYINSNMTQMFITPSASNLNELLPHECLILLVRSCYETHEKPLRLRLICKLWNELILEFLDLHMCQFSISRPDRYVLRRLEIPFPFPTEEIFRRCTVAKEELVRSALCKRVRWARFFTHEMEAGFFA